MLNSKDRMILEKIVAYCEQIAQTVTRFGVDYETYSADFVYRNACCMCILQIGRQAKRSVYADAYGFSVAQY